ncbi:DUF5689 domain-containing protein [Flammeovirga sp. SJP92]|uniref:DUF5689 domain-containing protein n=1 Tax=Flammeovirga sp. SJP92 TaxID=1775430 RepID=UPI0007878265|nr:DUF5689 domain-containing protein [Flammeovirga sp. SJP92]KXX70309.1 hypothetical protein AVL50_11935 [Flammeovirga sp. SJP92]
MKTQRINKVLQFLLISSFISMAFFGCTKEDEIDGPGTDPEVPSDVEVNSTIADVLAMYESNKDGDDDFFQVTEELTFAGTVISSDETGNVYKYITVQDEAGNGIQVKLNATNLYQSFPQGRKVAIKAEDMYIGNYGGLVQLGGLYNDALGSIEEDAIANHVFLQEGEAALPTPTTIDLDALPENIGDLYNTLVKVTGVQFAQEGVEFASQENNSTNLDLVNKNGESIILRSSKYATFAGETVPSKSGDITAILTVFNGTLQLTLVNLEDIDFNNDRFEIEINLDGEGTLENPYSISDVKKLGSAQGVWVKGFIIGSVNGGSLENDFVPGAADNSSASNVIIAAGADIADATLGVPVQLSSGSAIREAVNLKDNPENAKKEIWIFGNIETYFNVPGLKSTTKYSFDGEDEGEVPVEDPDFDGAGSDINGSDLTETTINFSTYNVASFAAWSASNNVATVNGYGKQGSSESWMITKEALTLEGTSFTNARLIVKETLKYFSKFDDVQILGSSDYTGTGNPNDATWTALTSDEDRNQGGDNLLNFAFDGAQYIAFRYTAADGSSAGSMQWDVASVTIGDKEEEEEHEFPAPGENYLTNGGFETWVDGLPANWSRTSGVDPVLETADVFEGNSAAKLDGKSYIEQEFKVQPGKTYVVSFQYKVTTVDENSGNTIRPWSNFKTSTGSATGDDWKPNEYLANNAEWTEASIELVAPADASTFNYSIRAYRGVTIIDDVKFIEKQ